MGQPVRMAIRAMLAALLLALAPGQAAAQGVPTPLLPGFPVAEEESEAPRQSRPVPDFREVRPATAEDYARVVGSAAATSPMAVSLDRVEGWVGVFRTRLKAIVVRLPDAWTDLGSTMRAASPTGKPIHFLGIAAFAVLLMVVGRAVAELFLVYVARPAIVRLQRPDPHGYAGKLPLLTARFAFTAFSVALTLAVAAAVGLFFHDGHKPTLTTVIVVFATYGAILLIHTFWRMVLAPYLPAYRLPAIDDREARALYRWLTAATVVGVLAAAFSHWVVAIGVPSEMGVLFTALPTLGAMVLLGIALWVNRHTLCTIALGGTGPDRRATWLQQAVALGWLPLSLIALAGTWADLVVRLVMGVDAGAERILAPFFVLLAGLLVYAFGAYASERAFAPRRYRLRLAPSARTPDVEVGRRIDGDEAGADGEGDEEGSGAGGPAVAAPRRTGASLQSFEDLGLRVASLFALGTVVWLAVWYWGGRAAFAESAMFGIAEDVVDVIFVGYVAFHAARIWLDRKIAEEGADEDPGAAILEGEGGGAGQSRLATLLPLVRNFILGIISVTVVLLVAVEMGINVAPLFAGAGIVGLAIGFGAQALVRDIISGAFFLIDDAFRKGEYIDVGSVKGTVERISVRSFQLRHHLGMLHTIPFGEVQFLTNYSRDWVMMKLPLRLTYDTDVEKVRKLIKKLGQSLISDPEVGDKFLQPLKSQGVIQMEDSAMIVRVKFMTRPGDQWVTRKRVYAEIRELFDREGIKFAHREVTVRIPDLPEGRPPTPAEAHAIGAATRANLDVIEAEERRMTGTGGPMDER